MIDYGEVLVYLCPDDAWTIGVEYESLEWRGSGEPPTKTECQAAWEVIKHNINLRPIRKQRSFLLAKSDWTQLIDVPVNAEAWAVYRQKLRDMPATITDPTGDIVWPTPPSN